LESSTAARDIHELRNLLEAWRDARRTAWQTVIKVITTGILAALLVGAAIKLKLMGFEQDAIVWVGADAVPQLILLR